MRFRNFILLLVLLYGASFLLYHRWDTNILYGGDSWGYYAYLPAVFIYGDLHDPVTTYQATGQVTGHIPALPEPGGELNVAANGHHIIKYTCGIALLQLPFFLIGHFAAGGLGFAQNGYTLPYLISVHLAVFFYLLLGFYALYRVLLRLVNPFLSLLTLAVLALGTNLYFFAVYSGTMAHAYLFALYALLLLATVNIYNRPGRRWALLLGVAAGLITLIRPVELICLSIPLLYGIQSRQDLQDRWLFIRQHLRLLLWVGLPLVACGLPQLLYWKFSTGQWLHYSYGEESFDWLQPHLWGGLFSYKNGWLVYTPLMLLALAGIYFLRRERQWLWPTAVFLALHLYITYSWWCWYYINGFGSRPMVEAYALLAISLAAALRAAFRHQWSTIVVSILLIACTGLNLFQTWQSKQGILLSEAANRGYYWSVFGKTTMDYGALVAFDSREQQPDTAQLQRRAVLWQQDFESSFPAGKKISEAVVYQGRKALILEPWDSLHLLQISLEAAKVPPGAYLSVQAMCYKEILEKPWYEMPFLAVSLERDGDIRRHRVVHLDNKLGNPGYNLWGGKAYTWGRVQQFVHIPASFRATDQIRVFLQARRQRVYVDEIIIEIWQ